MIDVYPVATPNQTPGIEQGFKNDPLAAAGDYLALGSVGRPGFWESDTAISFIHNSKPDRPENVLDICRDLSTVVERPTKVIAGLFVADEPTMPKAWREDPEMTRAVLTMTARMESGVLRAKQAQSLSPIDMRVNERRAKELDDFADALQAKQEARHTPAKKLRQALGVLANTK